MQIYAKILGAGLENRFAAAAGEEPISEQCFDLFAHNPWTLKLELMYSISRLVHKICADRNVSWKDVESDWDHSFVAAIQLFSGKSQVSFRAFVLSFYRLPIVPLNFLKKRHWERITEDRTLLASLAFSHDSSNVDNAVPSLNSHKNYGRVDLLQSFHESMKWALEMLRSNALSVFKVPSPDGHKYLLHSMIASAVTDIPEAKDSHFLKSGSMTNIPASDVKLQKINFHWPKDVKGES